MKYLGLPILPIFRSVPFGSVRIPTVSDTGNFIIHISRAFASTQC